MAQTGSRCNAVAKAPAAATARETAKPATALVGSVILRGVKVALDTDVGQAFVIDCARNTEGMLSDDDVKSKWALRDDDWLRLSDNSALLQMVRAERERRILSGEAAREAAQRHFAKAPTVLNRILTNELVSPRHRIEAARELRHAAGDGGPPGTGENFTINITIGDKKLVYEVDGVSNGPPPADDGEAP